MTKQGRSYTTYGKYQNRKNRRGKCSEWDHCRFLWPCLQTPWPLTICRGWFDGPTASFATIVKSRAASEGGVRSGTPTCLSTNPLSGGGRVSVYCRRTLMHTTLTAPICPIRVGLCKKPTQNTSCQPAHTWLESDCGIHLSY